MKLVTKTQNLSQSEDGEINLLIIKCLFDDKVNFSGLREAIEERNYVMKEERLYINSPYDCTGLPFTLSMKVKDQFVNDTEVIFLVYHTIGYDF